jgi:acyl carrier protein
MTRQLRNQLRAVLTKLGGKSGFADSQDVFATSIVRSMNLLELICFLEDMYQIEISQRDVFDGNLKSVDRMVAFILDRRPELARCA